MIDDANEATETTTDDATNVARASISEPSLDDAMLSAMDDGVKAETPEPMEATEDAGAVTDEPTTTDDAAVAANDTDDASKETTASDADGDDDKQEPPERDDDTEKEIADLGLKDKTATRFRELATTAKAYAPIHAAMAAAGIESADDIKALSQRGKDFEDIVAMVQDTGATPEQYGQALDMVKAINGALKGDRDAAEHAYEFLSQELGGLAKLLGKPGAGFDPLADHADLQREVDDGDLSRERALEIVQQRNALNMDTWRSQQQQQQTTQQQAYQQGVRALNDLGDQLEASDPTYRQKVQYLLPTLEVIKQQLPPAQWVTATQRAYAQIPNLSAQRKPRASVGPVRAGALAPALEPTTDDPMEAMELGIKAVG